MVSMFLTIFGDKQNNIFGQIMLTLLNIIIIIIYLIFFVFLYPW